MPRRPGGNNWTLAEMSKVRPEDVDKLGILDTEWKRQITFPLQEIIGIQSSIPKAKGGFRMVCAQGTLCRIDCKLDSFKERAFNTSIAGADDTSRPGSSCLRTMEDRMIFIYQLSVCNLEVMVALWDLGKFYDTIPFPLIRPELNLFDYPKTTTTRILIQHGAPMLIKSIGAYS